MSEELPDGVEEVTVARFGPEDRLLVKIDAGDGYAIDEDAQKIVRETLRRWSGLPDERVLLVTGADVSIEVVRPDTTEPEEDDDATLSVRD